MWNNSSEAINTTQEITTQSDLEANANTPGCNLFSFIVYTFFCGTLCVLGVIGNIATFAVFQMDNLKTSTTFLFQGLALTDTVLLVMCFPVYCIQPAFDYMGGRQDAFQDAHAYILVYLLPIALLAQTATIWVTVVVGINRYIAVCLPYQASRLCSVAKARQYLAAVLICSLIYCIPRFLQAKVVDEWSVEYNRTIHMAKLTDIGENKYFNIIYNNICYLIFMLFFPVLLLTILNIRLINTLKAINQRRSEMQTRQQKQDNNVTFVLIIVVLVFTICQTPALINQILWNVLPDNSRHCGGLQFYFRPLSNLMVILNSSVNFIIYYLFNKRFKSVVEQHLCWSCMMNNENGQRHSLVKNNGATETLITHV